MGDERILATCIKAVLIDLGGVVYVGDTVLSGALEALQRLRQAKIPMRFITNTTRRSQRMILADLAVMGIEIRAEELLTPSQVARDYLLNRHLSPFLLVHPKLEEDFAGVSLGKSEAVIVGDAGSALTYDRLNAAYRKVQNGAEFLALAMNRNFLDADGVLSLDAGPFVVALEYASGRRARVLGKPSPEFFKLALEGLDVAAGAVAMIGDDAEADVAGGMAAGLHGILVRTGKYRPGDEQRLDRSPTYIAGDLSESGGCSTTGLDAPRHKRTSMDQLPHELNLQIAALMGVAVGWCIRSHTPDASPMQMAPASPGGGLFLPPPSITRALDRVRGAQVLPQHQEFKMAFTKSAAVAALAGLVLASASAPSKAASTEYTLTMKPLHGVSLTSVRSAPSATF